MRSKTLLALLSVVLMLGILLSGCGKSDGGSVQQSPSSNVGNGANAGTMDKDSGDDLLLYITMDNQWMLSYAESGAASAVISQSAYLETDALSAQSEYSEYIPNLRPGFETMVWFTSDAKSVYFLADINAGNYTANLYRLDRSALEDDLSNAAECVEQVEQNVVVSVNNQILGDGVLFRNSENVLVYYDGEKSVSLAQNVVPMYGADRLPADGSAAFVPLNGGETVAYTVAAGDVLSLYVAEMSGGSGREMCADVYKYFCDNGSDRVFFQTDEGVWVAPLDGEPVMLAESGIILSVYGNTAYYNLYEDDGNTTTLCYYDGENSRVVSEDPGVDVFGFGSAEDGVAIYCSKADRRWYCAIGAAEPSLIPLEEGCVPTEYYGMFGNGSEIALSANGSLVVLSVADGKVTGVQTLDDDCWRVRVREDSLSYMANTESADDLTLYKDGQTTVLAQEVSYSTTCQYSDDTVLTIRDGALVEIADGTETYIADSVIYYLRLGDGRILYSTQDALNLYDGNQSVRIAESAFLMYCASGEYNSGSTYIDYPKF